jgi:threonine dehydrogenase-like Zn-dependent dehydrogenase
MRAAVMKDWTLRVDDVADPRPGPGQVLTRVLACGICGSDLHMLQHGREQLALGEQWRHDQPPDPMGAVSFSGDQDLVMGHEFCCEVIELGPDCSNTREGDIVVSMPGAFDLHGVHALGYSNRYNGGYAEQMVLNDVLCMKVPAGVSPELAAMTEPLAVGIHAVAKSRITAGESAIVYGLGPVGLAVIAGLKMLGLGPVIGADFSSTRRALAAGLGCDVVVDPRERPAIAAWRDIAGSKPLVIFEAVGVPGMLHEAMRVAPRGSRITVVGVCMQADPIHPMLGISKELNLQFVLGYEPHEFAAALAAIAGGTVDLGPWHTGSVDVDGVPQAFADLSNPDRHAKILVTPGRSAPAPSAPAAPSAPG